MSMKINIIETQYGGWCLRVITENGVVIDCECFELECEAVCFAKFLLETFKGSF